MLVLVEMVLRDHMEMKDSIKNLITLILKFRTHENQVGPACAHARLRRVLPSKGNLPVSPVKMLAGREGNYSGKRRFSSADCCHVLSQYVPIYGPSVIDSINSCAYVSQFSEDGSLFVAGFQESHKKIYNVDRGWKVQKDIRARSLRWTITDTSLSPDRHFLRPPRLCPSCAKSNDLATGEREGVIG